MAWSRQRWERQWFYCTGVLDSGAHHAMAGKIDTGDASPILVGERLYLFTRQDDKEVILCTNGGLS